METQVFALPPHNPKVKDNGRTRFYSQYFDTALRMLFLALLSVLGAGGMFSSTLQSQLCSLSAFTPFTSDSFHNT